MTRHHHYHLDVTTENFIPHDVLIEHLAVALRDFRFLGKNTITLMGVETAQDEEPKMARQHPFDGPEVFDDYAPGTSREGSFAPTDIGARELLDDIDDPFPLTTQVIDRIKETRRHGND